MFLLVGGDAEIGAATTRFLRTGGHSVAATTRRLDCIAPDRPLLDLSHSLDDWEPPAGSRAACIFAAVAKLGACHNDPVGSAHINVTQTLAVCERLIARGIYVLLLSTNQVFDGHTPHVPADAPTAPVSEYGRQKARIEAALLAYMAHGAPVAILRLAKVISRDTKLIHDWVAKLNVGDTVQAFHDMMLAPAPVDIVVGAIVQMLQHEARGIFQLSGPRDISYVEVGRYLARRLGADPKLVVPDSVRAAGLPVGANPLHTTLDSSALRDRYGITVPEPWKAIDAIAAPRQEVF